MTKEQMDDLWERIKTKWGSVAPWSHFENSYLSMKIEYQDWQKNIGMYDQKLVDQAIDYYIRHKDNGRWPKIPAVLDCVRTVNANKKQNKFDSGAGVWITKEFHGRMSQLDFDIREGNIPSCKEESMRTMAESLRDMYYNFWVKPALELAKREKEIER